MVVSKAHKAFGLLLLGLLAAWLVLPRPVIVPTIRGRVVDARDGHPMAGVNIVAAWRLVRGTVGGYQTAGHLVIQETTSAGDGSYELGGFTRFYVPLLRSVDRIESPVLYFFEDGYHPKTRANISEPPVSTGPFVYRSSWDGKNVDLAPLDVTNAAAVSDEISGFRVVIMNLVRKPRSCRWDQVQSMLLAIDASPQRPWDLTDMVDEAKRCDQAAPFELRLKTVSPAAAAR